MDFTWQDGRIIKGVSLNTSNGPFPNAIKRMGDGYSHLEFWDMNLKSFADGEEVTLYGLWHSKGKYFRIEEIVKGA